MNRIWEGVGPSGGSRDGKEEAPGAPGGPVGGVVRLCRGALGTNSCEETSVEPEAPEPGKRIVRALELKPLSEN